MPSPSSTERSREEQELSKRCVVRASPFPARSQTPSPKIFVTVRRKGGVGLTTESTGAKTTSLLRDRPLSQFYSKKRRLTSGRLFNPEHCGSTHVPLIPTPPALSHPRTVSDHGHLAYTVPLHSLLDNTRYREQTRVFNQSKLRIHMIPPAVAEEIGNEAQANLTHHPRPPNDSATQPSLATPVSQA